MKKNILFVCLGNICRSPAAEAVFLNAIRLKGLEKYFYVDSAGTGSWHVGKDADHRMRDAAEKRGIYITSKARQININDFQLFDLIFTMDNTNLSDVKLLSQKVVDKNIAKIYPILSYSSQSHEIEVPDPYYGGEDGFDIVLDLLNDAIDGLIESLID